MVPVATFLARGLAAIAQAQDQCVSALESAAADVGCALANFSYQCISSNSMAINTAILSGVLKGCGPATSLAVEGSASAVYACAAPPKPAEASTTSSTPSTSSALALVASSAAPATPAPQFPTTSTTASATAVSPSAGPGSRSTTSSSAAQFTGVTVKTVVSIGRCLGVFIALMATL